MQISTNLYTNTNNLNNNSYKAYLEFKICRTPLEFTGGDVIDEKLRNFSPFVFQ